MPMVAEPGGPGPTIADTGHRCGLHSSVPGVPLLTNRRDAISGASKAFRVSEWSVRRKVVAVLAVPVMLAVVFGGLRVASELPSASDDSNNQQRSTVLGFVINDIAATER